MNKFNSTEQKPMKDSNESTPVAAEKLMDGLAPGSRWSKTTVAGVVSAEPSTENSRPLLDPATMARLKEAGHLSCPLCRRTQTVSVKDIRPGTARGETEYVLECSYDPHSWIVSMGDKKRLF